MFGVTCFQFLPGDLAGAALAKRPAIRSGVPISVCLIERVAALAVRFRLTDPPLLGVLNREGPSAIAGLVIAVVVWVAIQFIFRRWARPHVGIEKREILPSHADTNAASSVVRKASHLGIPATAKHPVPNRVFRNRKPVRAGLGCRAEVELGHPLSSQAATGTIIAAQEHTRTNSDLGAAIAATQPAPVPMLTIAEAAQSGGFSNHKEPTKALTGNAEMAEISFSHKNSYHIPRRNSSSFPHGQSQLGAGVGILLGLRSMACLSD